MAEGHAPLAWRFDRFTLDLARDVLLGPDGAAVPLRPKALALLKLMVVQAGRVVSREAIMTAVWPDVVVGDESITQCVRDIRKACGDPGDLLQTVPKRGYVFTAQVVRNDDWTEGPYGVCDSPARRPPDKPSIAVLPFQNMSGDPDQDWFADGMVEDITTALARLRWLFVIARNSSFVYRGRSVGVQQIGRELGVRYVLEGSVRRANGRVRITGQLIEAETGGHLWAERFDGDLADLFDLQDSVAASVVGALAPKLEAAEMERAARKPTASLDAYDYYLRGMAAFHRFTHADNVRAAALFASSIELDPSFASAYGMAARCYLQRKAFGWSVISPAEVAEAEFLARRAADLGREDAVALGAAAGTLLTVVGEVEDGAALIDRASALSPNLAWLWNFSAYARLLQGAPEVAVEHATRAMRLSPYDPQMFGMKTAVAFGHFFLGDYAEALAWAEQAQLERPSFLVSAGIAAASAALAGNLPLAARAMDRLRRINPALRLSNLGGLLPFRRASDLMRWAAGLRAAGLPE